MSVTHPSTVRGLLAEVISGIANAGSTPRLVIGTSSLALPSTGVIADITIPDFGEESNGVITSATTDLEEETTGAGTAAIAIVCASDGTEAFRGECGVGSGEVQLSSLSYEIGDTIRITNDLTYTAPL